MTTSCSEPMSRAQRLGLYGLVENWDELGEQPWVLRLLEVEEKARKERSLSRRLKSAHLGHFRALADFDWGWPKKIDRAQVEELFSLDFIREAENPILIGPNGVGKTLIAQNLAHHAVLRGFTVLFTPASEMLGDLASRDHCHSLQQRLRQYVRPQLLVLDEVGYLSYDNRHADLLFQVVTRRYERAGCATVVTTNKPFSEWGQVFPNVASVVTLIDRLTHRAEIIQIEAESYRFKESKQRAADKARRRQTRPKAAKS